MPQPLVQLNIPSHGQKEPCGPSCGCATRVEPQGPEYWRSVNELADTPEFREFLHREFPVAASEWHDPVSRRSFLKLMGASLALAGFGGAAGCRRRPDEKIVPYVQPPEQVVPGKPLYFATAMPFNGYGRGVVVESHMGRPTKAEGNPDHQASLGATDAFAQASILSLYDPDRSQTVMQGGHISTWSEFLKFLSRRMESKRQAQGAGVRILTETVTSPTLADQIGRLLAQFPQAKWHQYQPVGRFNVAQGTVQAFDRPLNPIYAFDRAACIVSLDSNFLQDEPGSIRYARQFIDGRRIRVPSGQLVREIDSDIRTKGEPTTAPAGSFRANRLYVAESTPTITGAMADHRVPLTPSQVDLVARALAVAVGVKAQGLEAPPLPQPLADWVNFAARDLLETSKQHKGATLVVAGPNQPPTVHALAHVMNGHLGAIGVTCAFTQPLENWPNPKEPLDPATSLRDLVEDMRRPDGDPQGVDTLIILGGNPAYDAPVDLDFAKQLQAFSSRPSGGGGGPGAGGLRNFTAHLSLYYDETSFYCQWHVPESHYLESWGDVRAYNGAVSVLQPLIAPLYNSRTAIEMLAAMLGQGDVSPLETVRNFWRGQNLVPTAQFDLAWDRWLQKGIIDGTAFPALREKPVANLNLAPAAPAAAGGYEVSFRPDPCVWDGRYANNGWLQELPKPLTKVTWDNAVYMSRNTAVALGVLTTKHDEAPTVTLSYSGRTLPDKEFPEELPVWVVPGHPDGSITIHLGYGRKRAGRVGGIDGQTRGFNAYALLTSDAPYFGGGVQINATGRTMQLACTQDHQLIEERRQLVKSHTIAQVERDFVRRGGASGHAEEGAEQTGPAETGHGEGHHASIYREYDYKHQRAWGMVIDMNACIGCNACVVACQAENNSPVVGKDQVLKGREMHWLRIDTYYRAAPGTADPVTNPETVFQPMLCQHCENAPCEVVCPVAATTHSHEGINEMTYNRCVGTRYCSNNCPYKVRRFNFLQYQDKTTPVLKLMRNPDVTVRDRGVMEKCTYCVQRVNQTRIELEKLIAIDADDATPPEQREQNARTRHELMRKLQTACQQSCPTEAIVFGDLHYVEPDGRKSRVARLRDDPLNYGLLTELNTQPRTTYLPRLRNPHPEVGPAEISPTGDRPPGSEAKA